MSGPKAMMMLQWKHDGNECDHGEHADPEVPYQGQALMSLDIQQECPQALTAHQCHLHSYRFTNAPTHHETP